MIQYEFRRILWPNCNPLYWVMLMCYRS